MKKTILCMLIAVMLVLSSMSVFAYDLASLDQYLYTASNEIGSVNAKNNTPTIDANISAGEGWSDAVAIDYTNMPTYWASSSRCIMSANLYFAWNTNGVYVAADITDPTMVLSTGEDEPNDSGLNEYGYNGDVFIFGIDPLAACFDSGMVSSGDRTAWYCMSMFEGGALKVFRTNANDGEVTDSVTAKGAKTSKGWALECMIPWDVIIEDTFVASMGDVDLTVDEITTAGAISNVGIIYMDRAVLTPDVEVFKGSTDETAEGDVFTLSRNISVPLVHADGQGWQTGGESLRSYGLKFAIADATGYAPETEAPVVDTEPVIEDTDPVEDETDDVTEDEPKDTEKEEKESNSPIRGNDEDKDDDNSMLVPIIIGVVAAVVVAAAVVVVIIILKKKKA